MTSIPIQDETKNLFLESVTYLKPDCILASSVLLPLCCSCSLLVPGMPEILVYWPVVGKLWYAIKCPRRKDSTLSRPKNALKKKNARNIQARQNTQPNRDTFKRIQIINLNKILKYI